MLLGLKTSGSLGNTSEFEYTFNLFSLTVIQPAQKTLEGIFNSMLRTNEISSTITFKDAELSTPTDANSQVIINNNK